MFGLYIVTGTPGAGKTLNTIASLFEDSRFKDRPIFTHGIPWSKRFPNIQKMNDEQVLEWYDLPLESVIVVDEAQYIFPNLSPAAKRPKHYTEFNVLRKRGYAVILITQHTGLIDSQIRRLTEEHVHYFRKRGQKRSTKYVYPQINETLSNLKKEGSEHFEVFFDKKYFDYYQSAQVHTDGSGASYSAKTKLILFGMGLLVLYILYAAYNLYQSRLATPDLIETASASNDLSVSGVVSSGKIGSSPGSLSIPNHNPILALMGVSAGRSFKYEGDVFGKHLFTVYNGLELERVVDVEELAYLGYSVEYSKRRFVILRNSSTGDTQTVWREYYQFTDQQRGARPDGSKDNKQALGNRLNKT